jgi:hypothetical protein
MAEFDSLQTTLPEESLNILSPEMSKELASAVESGTRSLLIQCG